MAAAKVRRLFRMGASGKGVYSLEEMENAGAVRLLLLRLLLCGTLQVEREREWKVLRRLPVQESFM